MFELRDLLFGALLPGALAALAALALARWARGWAFTSAASWWSSGRLSTGALVGAACGLVVAACSPALIPTTTGIDPWVPWLAAAAALGALVEAALVRPARRALDPGPDSTAAQAAALAPALLFAPVWLRGVVRLPALVFVAVVLLRPRADALGPSTHAAAVAGAVVGGLLLGLSLDLLLVRRGSLGGALLLLAWAGPLSGALFGSGSLVYGKLGACVAAVTGGLAAGAALTRLVLTDLHASWVPRPPALALGVAPALGAVVVALLLRGNVYFDLVTPSAVALLVAPSAAWLAEPLRRSASPRRRLAGEALGLLLVAAVAGGAAAYSAAQLEQPEPSPYPY